MKLQCEVEVVNRLHNTFNIRNSGKYLKSTLAIGKEPKCENGYFIILFTTVNKTGTRYKVKNIQKCFVKCINEGKSTIRFEEPPHDLLIKSEVLQLKCFFNLIKSCFFGNTKNVNIGNLSNISIIAKDNAPSKLVIRDRSEFPTTGFPRTLKSLYITGLNLCNFRRDILMLRHLTILDLSNNEIEKIPYEFGRMPSLLELYLANNQLGVNDNVDWRWLLGAQIINTLKLLDLSKNKLTYLPKAIWKLQKLVTLKIDNNLLTELPATIGRIGTLRYLTVSTNNLTSLPCSLMQCRLEHFDVTSNLFTNYIDDPTKSSQNSQWDLYVGKLINLTSKVVLKNKLYYDSKIIPWTLVEFLDNANMCICGAPVVQNSFSLLKWFELKDLFRNVVFDQHGSTVNFVCYFCSLKCSRIHIMK